MSIARQVEEQLLTLITECRLSPLQLADLTNRSAPTIKRYMNRLVSGGYAAVDPASNAARVWYYATGVPLPAAKASNTKLGGNVPDEEQDFRRKAAAKAKLVVPFYDNQGLPQSFFKKGKS